MSESSSPPPFWRDTARSGDRPSPKRGRDPFVARAGALVLVGLLAIPVVGAVTRDGGSAAGPRDDAAAVMATTDGDGSIALIDPSAVTTMAAAPTAPTDPATQAPATQAPATQAPATVATQAPATVAPTTRAPATTSAATAPATTEAQQRAEALAAPTTTTEPPCDEYEVGAGDYWIGIADRAGVSTKDLLAANDASSGTAIYPGSTICLPAGAQDPGPPPAPTTTEAPSTTVAPTTTAKPATTTTKAPSTTVKPTTTTTVAPTTTKPAKTYTRDEVTAIIASVFPADQLDTALRIADRESNLQPGVRNWCCYGLFQINWSSHRSWLAAFGVTSADQLYDPLVNAQMAWALYQRSGGWGPWGGVPD